MRTPLLVLIFLSLPVSSASAMPVSEFVNKANALEKKGPMALFSGDVKLLKSEISGAVRALRAERAIAEKAGRKPATCIPPTMRLSNTELLAHFRSIPPARRGMTVKAGFAELVKKKWPCPA